MKVTAISMVRNEGDVIEAFIRHHLPIVDEFLLIDHGSVDGTHAILDELTAEGLPIRVREQHSPVQRQNVLLTELMREAVVSGGADLVLPLDADEFLVAPGEEVRKGLERITPEKLCTVDTRLYIPTSDDPPNEPNVLRRIQKRRELASSLGTRKVLVPASLARDESLSLAQGNHVLVDGRSGMFVQSARTEGLALAHFPVRSSDQLARKVLGGWPAHVARPDCPPDGAFHWKRAFDQVVARGRLTAQELEALAFDYSSELCAGEGERELLHDPVPAPFELRYRARHEPTPLETLAHTAVRLAEELSELGAGAGPHELAPPRGREEDSDSEMTGRVADVAAIVVTHDSAGSLPACLDSLAAQADDLELAIVVADSGSTDRVEVICRERRVDFLAGANRGYGAAINRALGQALVRTARYILALNPDVEIAEGSLADFISLCDARPECAVFAPRHVDQHDRLVCSIGREPSPADSWHTWRTGWPTWLWDASAYERERRCDWVTGAFMLIRREVFEALGGFDERFFLFSEEVDFCTRVRRQGWQVAYLPQLTITHWQADRALDDHRERLLIWSELIYMRKWFGLRDRAAMRLALVARVTRQLLRRLRAGQPAYGDWVRLCAALRFRRDRYGPAARDTAPYGEYSP